MIAVSPIENKIPNRIVVSETLTTLANSDPTILVLTSDSRGSASLKSFETNHSDKLIEVGIAEQNLVGIASGLARSGKKPFVCSPACFLSMRSIEQIKVDVAYSNTNVKLIGISGGVSYGSLGMSHHSLQDIAVMRAIPNMEIYLPADRFETQKMIQEVAKSGKPAYIRIGRNPVSDIYLSEDYSLRLGKSVLLKEGKDFTIAACGETVRVALDAAYLLEEKGFKGRVLNMHSIKPFDRDGIIQAAKETGCVVSIEEHSIYGGLGSTIAEILAEECPVPMKILGFPDEPVVTGTSKEVFSHYQLTPSGVALEVENLLK